VAESTVNQEVQSAPISRTLLAAARSSRAPVRLEDRGDLGGTASIMQSGVSSALCTPIIPATDDALSVQMVAYLDSPSGSRPPADDAAAFAHAACDLAALAIESEERRSLQSEVDSMHQVQVNMMPPALIQAGDLHVVTRCIPGSGAAGDLVGYCPTANGGHVLIVVDVSGKGPAAAMLMASVVSHLHASLALHNDLPDAVARLNNHVQERFRSERFVTAVFVHQPSDGSVHVMAAGHGLIARVTAAGVPTLLEAPGGPPLGVVQEQVFGMAATTVDAGDRLVIFTDGVTEQQSPAGHMFRIE
jgi:serine phosphatase RsbU (regulator of sigma subunit)